MRRLRWRSLAFGSVVLSSLVVLAAPLGPSWGLTYQKCEEDLLAKPITVEFERVYLGELVEKLAQLSGVDLRLEGRTAESADPLSVSVRELPLRQVMELVVSLYSYKGGVWQWRKEAGDRGDRYTLTPTLGAKTLGSQLEDWTLRAYTKQLNAFRRSRDMTPEEQSRLREEDTLLPPFPTEEISRGEADLFLDVLTGDQRMRVLRGEEQIRVPVERLPPAGRKFLDSIHAQGVKSAKEQDPNSPGPPPFEWVEFQRTVYPGYATADLRACLGDKIGFMYNTVLGGKRMNAAFKKHLHNLWLGSGGTAESAIGQETLKQLVEVPARVGPWTLGARLIEVSRASGAPVLCRMSHLPPADPGPAVGAPLAQFLVDLDNKHAYMSKWHSGALLLSTSRWHLPEETSMRVDWEVVKGLKAVDAKNRGLLSVDVLSSTAHRLSASQVTGLGVEWPAFNHVARYWPIFALCGSPLVSSQMMSERGYTIKDSDFPRLMQCAAFRRRVRAEGQHALRVTEAAGNGPLPSDARIVRIEIKSPDGRWTDIGGFAMLARTDEAKTTRPQ